MIWCVEDDASIRDIEVYTLSSTGFDARGFADGVSFWSALQTEKPDLVVLDVMLPGVDGIELLQRMKASAELRTIPVVMATAKGAEYDKIQSLDLGADDYLVKPFGVMEMVSRVKAVLRRCHPADTGHVLSAGGLSMDLDCRTVTADGQRLQLTYKEFELLRLFLSHPGMTVECIYVPLMMTASKAADELSIASVTRGIENPNPRTCLVQIKCGIADWMIMAVAVAFLIFELCVRGGVIG